MNQFKTELQKAQQKNEEKILHILSEKISSFESKIDEKMSTLRTDSLAQTLPNTKFQQNNPFDEPSDVLVQTQTKNQRHTLPRRSAPESKRKNETNNQQNQKPDVIRRIGKKSNIKQKINSDIKSDINSGINSNINSSKDKVVSEIENLDLTSDLINHDDLEKGEIKTNFSSKDETHTKIPQPPKSGQKRSARPVQSPEAKRNLQLSSSQTISLDISSPSAKNKYIPEEPILNKNSENSCNNDQKKKLQLEMQNTTEIINNKDSQIESDDEISIKSTEDNQKTDNKSKPSLTMSNLQTEIHVPKLQGPVNNEKSQISLKVSGKQQNQKDEGTQNPKTSQNITGNQNDSNPISFDIEILQKDSKTELIEESNKELSKESSGRKKVKRRRVSNSTSGSSKKENGKKETERNELLQTPTKDDELASSSESYIFISDKPQKENISEFSDSSKPKLKAKMPSISAKLRNKTKKRINSNVSESEENGFFVDSIPGGPLSPIEKIPINQTKNDGRNQDEIKKEENDNAILSFNSEISDEVEERKKVRKRKVLKNRRSSSQLSEGSSISSSKIKKSNESENSEMPPIPQKENSNKQADNDLNEKPLETSKEGHITNQIENQKNNKSDENILSEKSKQNILSNTDTTNNNNTENMNDNNNDNMNENEAQNIGNNDKEGKEQTKVEYTEDIVSDSTPNKTKEIQTTSTKEENITEKVIESTDKIVSDQIEKEQSDKEDIETKPSQQDEKETENVDELNLTIVPIEKDNFDQPEDVHKENSTSQNSQDEKNKEIEENDSMNIVFEESSTMNQSDSLNESKDEIPQKEGITQQIETPQQPKEVEEEEKPIQQFVIIQENPPVIQTTPPPSPPKYDDKARARPKTSIKIPSILKNKARNINNDQQSDNDNQNSVPEPVPEIQQSPENKSIIHPTPAEEEHTLSQEEPAKNENPKQEENQHDDSFTDSDALFASDHEDHQNQMNDDQNQQSPEVVNPQESEEPEIDDINEDETVSQLCSSSVIHSEEPNENENTINNSNSLLIDESPNNIVDSPPTVSKILSPFDAVLEKAQQHQREIMEKKGNMPLSMSKIIDSQPDLSMNNPANENLISLSSLKNQQTLPFASFPEDEDEMPPNSNSTISDEQEDSYQSIPDALSVPPKANNGFVLQSNQSLLSSNNQHEEEHESFTGFEFAGMNGRNGSFSSYNRPNPPEQKQQEQRLPGSFNQGMLSPMDNFNANNNSNSGFNNGFNNSLPNNDRPGGFGLGGIKSQVQLAPLGSLGGSGASLPKSHSSDYDPFNQPLGGIGKLSDKTLEQRPPGGFNQPLLAPMDQPRGGGFGQPFNGFNNSQDRFGNGMNNNNFNNNNNMGFGGMGGNRLGGLEQRPPGGFNQSLLAPMDTLQSRNEFGNNLSGGGISKAPNGQFGQNNNFNNFNNNNNIANHMNNNLNNNFNNSNNDFNHFNNSNGNFGGGTRINPPGGSRIGSILNSRNNDDFIGPPQSGGGIQRSQPINVRQLQEITAQLDQQPQISKIPGGIPKSQPIDPKQLQEISSQFRQGNDSGDSGIQRSGGIPKMAPIDHFQLQDLSAQFKQGNDPKPTDLHSPKPMGIPKSSPIDANQMREIQKQLSNDTNSRNSLINNQKDDNNLNRMNNINNSMNGGGGESIPFVSQNFQQSQPGFTSIKAMQMKRESSSSENMSLSNTRSSSGTLSGNFSSNQGFPISNSNNGLQPAIMSSMNQLPLYDPNAIAGDDDNNNEDIEDSPLTQTKENYTPMPLRRPPKSEGSGFSVVHANGVSPKRELAPPPPPPSNDFQTQNKFPTSSASIGFPNQFNTNNFNGISNNNMTNMNNMNNDQLQPFPKSGFNIAYGTQRPK
ncbi:hypothetical protein TRFO_37293 [Tritrichomonas foetus]|uniref:Uncharacterized protein n=1 Tax=Tritrichomonas foetus TaxID=1144522 RepID=A0A1J4JE37_9EUKA|nr:hypothetical protein TRFO_37293 [Tritrichomonas foetus]|eukprot:OHS96551.1 hypothetical protein TRFO_37293 [Tritrichomonas foetus]